MMYTKKGTEEKIYIYNLTKLKGNETKGKQKNGTFFYKEKKTNKAKPKKNEKKKQKNETNEIVKI